MLSSKIQMSEAVAMHYYWISILTLTIIKLIQGKKWHNQSKKFKTEKLTKKIYQQNAWYYIIDNIFHILNHPQKNKNNIKRLI